MLASEFHLKKNSEIKRATKMGYKIDHPWYTACLYYRGDAEHPRFAFVISKKISKLATQRNRLKRVLSDTIRYNFQAIPKGLDAVFLVKVEIANKMTEDIQREFTSFVQTHLK